MPKYVIEREIPGAGKLTAEQLKSISQTSCGVLNNLGPQIQWVQSYVTDDKIYCVYIAPNEEMVRKHAKEGGFPANSVSRVSTIRPDHGRIIWSIPYWAHLELERTGTACSKLGLLDASKFRNHFLYFGAFFIFIFEEITSETLKILFLILSNLKHSFGKDAFERKL